MEKEIEEENKNYRFICNFVEDYCKDEEDRKEFFKHLSAYIDDKIELENEI